MKKLAVLLFAFPALLAAYDVAYYPRDFTSPTDKALAIPGETGEIRAASERVAKDYVCGVYRGPGDMLGGLMLHVFPDGSAMLERWCDVCPQALVGEGTWTFQPHGIRIKWKTLHFESANEAEFLAKSYGECKELGLYLVFEDKAVKDVILVSREYEAASTIQRWFVRSREYVDWPKIHDGLKQTKG